ncbi:Bug family tripartite tricarboxylate transporter substrate binding protein [Aquabacterium sp.]|uniref:Bug family tripartite tricarboxylate transporter substrate binding protein n=1 Tax=Aquabacterium sp. TaxID=1872578 RepID=UPI003784E4DE
MKLLNQIATAGLLSLTALSAWSQTYPDKPVKVVVTTVPGPLDAFARAVLEQMQRRLKQPFVVENKAGAGGNLGADIVAKSPADGYTLLFALDTTFTVNPTLYKKMPFDVTKDFVPIAVPVTYSQALAVNPNLKVASVADFVKLAKDKHLTYASGGNGSPSHLTMAAFMATAGLDMTHVPYKGTGASVIDVMAGQVDSVFAVGSGILPQAKAGKLRALAVSGDKRSGAAPELPTIAESGFPSFNASFAYALLAPAGTPEPIVKLLAREVELAMNTPEVKELNRQADYTATGLTQPQSAAWLADARHRWAEVIRKSNITAD